MVSKKPHWIFEPHWIFDGSALFHSEVSQNSWTLALTLDQSQALNPKQKTQGLFNFNGPPF